MEIVGFEELPKLFVSPIENLTDEFTGTVKDFRGLYKVPKENIPFGNLHQQICNIAKYQFDATNGQCNLFGLNFTTDEQIVNRISRSNGSYKKLQMPNTNEGMMNINVTKRSFNFLKSLDISH